MAYLVYIVRQDDYSDPDEESKISLNEWEDYINSDSELEKYEGYQVNLPVELDIEDIVPVEGTDDSTCEWIGHPRSDADTIPCLNYSQSKIYSPYPDKHTIGKMIRIAEVLNAKVRGDDGEYYDETFFSNGGYPVNG